MQTMDDQSLLQDIHRTIKELLKEHRHSESDIRQLLSDAIKLDAVPSRLFYREVRC